jgi:hypothetical protein
LGGEAGEATEKILGGLDFESTEPSLTEVADFGDTEATLVVPIAGSGLAKPGGPPERLGQMASPPSVAEVLEPEAQEHEKEEFVVRIRRPKLRG